MAGQGELSVEVRGWKPEDRGQKSEGRGQTSEDTGQRTAKTEVRDHKSEVGRLSILRGRTTAEDGRPYHGLRAGRLRASTSVDRRR
jgi:hypothetical protein